MTVSQFCFPVVTNQISQPWCAFAERPLFALLTLEPDPSWSVSAEWSPTPNKAFPVRDYFHQFHVPFDTFLGLLFYFTFSRDLGLTFLSTFQLALRLRIIPAIVESVGLCRPIFLARSRGHRYERMARADAASIFRHKKCDEILIAEYIPHK